VQPGRCVAQVELVAQVRDDERRRRLQVGEPGVQRVRDPGEAIATELHPPAAEWRYLRARLALGSVASAARALAEHVDLAHRPSISDVLGYMAFGQRGHGLLVYRFTLVER